MRVWGEGGLAGSQNPDPPPIPTHPACRRVALAVQLVRRPALLALDEPLAGLDWRARAELLQV